MKERKIELNKVSTEKKKEEKKYQSDKLSNDTIGRYVVDNNHLMRPLTLECVPVISVIYTLSLFLSSSSVLSLTRRRASPRARGQIRNPLSRD